jgi:hypothetical protein
VLLLVDGKSSSTPAVTSWIQAAGGLTELVIVGGSASVTAAALATVTALLGG